MKLPHPDDLPESFFEQDAEEFMKYAIWSVEHNAWWAPNELGYVDGAFKAGLYEKADADRICSRANQYVPAGHINEIAIPQTALDI